VRSHHEPLSRRSEERPRSTVGFSRSDSLFLLSAKIALPERAQLLNYLTDRDDSAKLCSRCHALRDPGAHSAQGWVAVFQRMERNMGRMTVSLPIAEESEGILSPKNCLSLESGPMP
jgi:hypothetical protein